MEKNFTNYDKQRILQMFIRGYSYKTLAKEYGVRKSVIVKLLNSDFIQNAISNPVIKIFLDSKTLKETSDKIGKSSTVINSVLSFYKFQYIPNKELLPVKQIMFDRNNGMGYEELSEKYNAPDYDIRFLLKKIVNQKDIKPLQEEIIKLQKMGLSKRQIANKLEIPISFVTRTYRKRYLSMSEQDKIDNYTPNYKLETDSIKDEKEVLKFKIRQLVKEGKSVEKIAELLSQRVNWVKSLLHEMNLKLKDNDIYEFTEEKVLKVYEQTNKSNITATYFGIDKSEVDKILLRNSAHIEKRDLKRDKIIQFAVINPKYTPERIAILLGTSVSYTKKVLEEGGIYKSKKPKFIENEIEILEKIKYEVENNNRSVRSEALNYGIPLTRAYLYLKNPEEFKNRRRFGENRSRFSENDLDKMWEEYKKGKSYVEISKIFNCSPGYIGTIIRKEVKERNI